MHSNMCMYNPYLTGIISPIMSWSHQAFNIVDLVHGNNEQVNTILSTALSTVKFEFLNSPNNLVLPILKTKKKPCSGGIQL